MRGSAKTRQSESRPMTAMRVVDIRTCPHGEREPMVLLEDEARARWLSFYLPPNEANRLARVLRRTRCPVVPVFDLLEQVLLAAGMHVLRAEIGGDERGVSASLVVRYESADVVFPCHPGDALALALRADSAIVATDEALAHACPVDQAVRARALRQWLDGLTPADFAAGDSGTMQP